MIVTTVDHAPAVNLGTHYFPLPQMLRIMRGELVFVAVACVLAYVGAWFKSRVN
jgi:hypothetical protein